MFCYQCQETAKNLGCVKKGVCGKDEETANLQDLLLHSLKGLAVVAELSKAHGIAQEDLSRVVSEALFVTVTNVNFNPQDIRVRIAKTVSFRDGLKGMLAAKRVAIPSEHP